MSISLLRTMVWLTRIRKSAWQFGIVATNRVEDHKIKTTMRDFAGTIRFENMGRHDEEFDTCDTKLVCNPKDLVVRARTERTHLRYILKNSTYVLEITRCRRYASDAPGAASPAQTTWEASMYDMEWDTKLAEQSTLRIGEQGSWSADLNAFFPATESERSGPADGFGDFLTHVKIVAAMLAGKQSEDQ